MTAFRLLAGLFCAFVTLAVAQDTSVAEVKAAFEEAHVRGLVQYNSVHEIHAA